MARLIGRCTEKLSVVSLGAKNRRFHEVVRRGYSGKMVDDELIIRHVIYDLDGTLVDSALDFDRMRCEMNLPRGAPILETLAQMPPGEAQRGWEIVERHELRGAERAVPYPGVLEFLAALAKAHVRQAVLTRNSRIVAHTMLRLIPFPFDMVVTRDDGPVKPDPQAVWRICESWKVAPGEVAIIGDSRFDMETGRRAGAWNVLYTRQREVNALPFADQAHFHLSSFNEIERFIAWLAQPG